MRITIESASELFAEMEALRRSMFLHPGATISTKDEFDKISKHLIVRVDQSLAGMVRFTPNPPCVNAIWSQGSALSPGLPHCVTFNRMCVTTQWKKLGLQRPLFVYALGIAWSQGYRWGMGAVEPNLPFRNFLKKAGFVHEGMPVVFSEPIGVQVLVQPLKLDMALNQLNWQAMLSFELSRLERMGHTISTELARTD